MRNIGAEFLTVGRRGRWSSGIDLGTLRLDAALYYSPGAADQILNGWREAAGWELEHAAYWDVGAALTTVGDRADCMPPLLDHHRADLDAGTPHRTPRRVPERCADPA